MRSAATPARAVAIGGKADKSRPSQKRRDDPFATWTQRFAAGRHRKIQEGDRESPLHSDTDDDCRFRAWCCRGQALHAQATPPAYVITIFDTEQVMNTSYPSLDPATFQPFGGHYIVHFGETVTFDGQPPNQIVIVAFDSIENAQAWRASDGFRKMYDVNKIAKVRAFAVQGTQ